MSEYKWGMSTYALQQASEPALTSMYAACQLPSLPDERREQYFEVSLFFDVTRICDFAQVFLQICQRAQRGLTQNVEESKRPDEARVSAVSKDAVGQN